MADVRMAASARLIQDFVTRVIEEEPKRRVATRWRACEEPRALALARLAQMDVLPCPESVSML